MREVRGKVAFITGGASGIGLGIARAFVNAGMKVVLADLRQDHLDAALADFGGRGQREAVHGIRLDVTDRAAFQRAADEAEQHFGKVHLLFNNAGMGLIGPIRQAKYADWDWGIGVMLSGVVNGIQTFLPRLLRHGEGGHICSTSSMSGLLPIARSAIYSACKAGLVGMTESLRAELADDNIEVSVFCPGPVQTNIRETGRIRPQQYRDSGFLDLEKELEQRPNSPNWMTIDECGERVLDGIRHNRMYIFTHREFREAMKVKCDALLAAFPDEPINEARASEIGFLLWPPVFKEAAALAPFTPGKDP
jgi:NAD(P)-dependent dehydrogenase (short-subunit alcohol dehydrogenase family)